MIKVLKIGMEVEVSRNRSLIYPYLKKDGIAYGLELQNTESIQIYEFGLKPVKFENERNTLRRFLYAGLFAYFNPYKSRPFSNGNYAGEWTERGESDHLHFSFSYFPDVEEILEKADSFFYYLIPLMARQDKDGRILFRDTVDNRANVYDDLLDSYLYEDYCAYDSKEDYLTINTTAGDVKTLEFRINENPFPILFILLLEPIMNNRITLPTEILEFCFHTYRSFRHYGYLKAGLPCIIRQAKEYYKEQSERFSANGKVYLKVLDIAERLTRKCDYIGEFNFRLFKEVNRWFMLVDKKHRRRIYGFRELIKSTSNEYFAMCRKYRRSFGFSPDSYYVKTFLDVKRPKFVRLLNKEIPISEDGLEWTWRIIV